MTTELLERSAPTATITPTSLDDAVGDVIATVDRVNARIPFLAPEFAPGTHRPAPHNTIGTQPEIVYPPAGTWVQVSVHSAAGSGSYRGRLVSVDDDVIVLREGAGYWHIEPGTVTGVRTVNRSHVRPAVVDPQVLARRCEQQAERILERWP